MQKIAFLEILETDPESAGQWLRLTSVRGRSNMGRVDLAEWAKPVGESTGMGSTSHSAAGTVLSQEEEEGLQPSNPSCKHH